MRCSPSTFATPPADGLSTKRSSASMASAGTGALQYVDQVITGQAMTLGVNDVFHFLGWMYILLIPFVWFAKPPFTQRGADAAH